MVNFNISEDEASKSLREKSFFLGALLHDIRGLDINAIKMSNSQIYLVQEMLRLDNLLTHFDSCGFLPLEAKDKAAKKDIVIPLIRVSLEGFFRVRYLFSEALRKQNFDPEIMSEKFSKIVDLFSFEYEGLLREDCLAELNLPVLKRQKVAKKKGDVSLKKIREETVGTLEEFDGGEDSKLYAFYRYCCFYAHGNLNEGITNEAGADLFLSFDLNFLLENMACNYLKSFSVMFKGNPLQMRIEEAFSKSLVNTP